MILNLKQKILSFFFVLFICFFSGFFSENVYAENVKKNEITIAMTTDDKFGYPTLVAIKSAALNSNKSVKLNFKVLVPDNFSEDHGKKISSLEKDHENISISFFKMGDAYKYARTHGRFPTVVFYRLAIHQVLPDKKCLFFDSDVIVLKDLTEHYNTDLSDNYIAGVCYMNRKKAKQIQVYANMLGIPNTDRYISAGMLLMNLEKMRNEKIEEKFKKFIKEKLNKNKKISRGDQDVINACCYGKILRWPKSFHLVAYYSLNIKDLKKDTRVLHFTGKPWEKQRDPNTISEIWWKYAEKTNYFKEIKEWSDNLKIKSEAKFDGNIHLKS
jgi:lipopolysaccharide biosynthesis glycosyltransferase